MLLSLQGEDNALFGDETDDVIEVLLLGDDAFVAGLDDNVTPTAAPVAVDSHTLQHMSAFLDNCA